MRKPRNYRECEIFKIERKQYLAANNTKCNGKFDRREQKGGLYYDLLPKCYCLTCPILYGGAYEDKRERGIDWNLLGEKRPCDRKVFPVKIMSKFLEAGRKLMKHLYPDKGECKLYHSVIPKGETRIDTPFYVGSIKETLKNHTVIEEKKNVDK
jgi:hypothetical protein